MNKKEMAPTGAATSAGAAWAEKSDGTISNFHCTSGGAGSQGRIYSLLPAGEQSALSAANLTRLAGFKSERSLRQAVDRERENNLILASDQGYFRPQSGDRGIAEIRAFLRRMDCRMRSNRRSTKMARAVLRELERKPLDGQQTLFNGGST